MQKEYWKIVAFKQQSFMLLRDQAQMIVDAVQTCEDTTIMEISFSEGKAYDDKYYYYGRLVYKYSDIDMEIKRIEYIANVKRAYA